MWKRQKETVPHTYLIDEIFYSIQGEGYWVGTPAVFVRFYGCNLHCPWCDTIQKGKTPFRMTARQIAEEVKQVGANGVPVILTGGEPMLQYDMELAAKLDGVPTHVETNGTIPIEEGLVDWITVSPKEGSKFKQTQGDELKVVYTGQDLSQYDELVPRFKHLYLQPCALPEGTNYAETIEKVKEDPRWRLSVQTHRMLKIR